MEIKEKDKKILINGIISESEILNSLGSVVLIVKIDEHGNTLPVWANNTYTELTGYTLKERMDIGFAKKNKGIIHPEDFDALNNEIKSIIKNNTKDDNYIFRLRIKPDKWKWFYFNAKPIRLIDNETYLLCNGIDLSKSNQLRFLTFIQDFNRLKNEDLINKLTDIEIDIVKLIITGFSVREIAKMRKKSFETVNNQKRTIFKKLNITKISDLVIFALENGIHPPIPS